MLFRRERDRLRLVIGAPASRIRSSAARCISPLLAAWGMGRRIGARVFLLSVVTESPVARMGEVLTKLGLRPVAKLVIGEPAPQISAYATEIGADLIVLSHRRQNLIQRWWSGPSGAYVSDNVNCSVLIGRKVISDEMFAAALERAAIVRSI